MTRSEEIKECNKKRTNAINANVLLLDTNQAKKNKCNRLNQEVLASNLSDNKSVANLKLLNKFTDLFTNQLFKLLNTKTETNL